MRVNLRDLPFDTLTDQLAGPGLRLRTGPFVVRICSDLAGVANGLALHYSEHAIEPESGFADFHVSVARPRTFRRWIQPQVAFRFDGRMPFHPLPAEQAFPVFEWGLNWCVAAHCHQYLTVHAAVMERSGRAVILPAPPGSGKSTLCAGLLSRGWRLFSDELTLIEPGSRFISSLARPVGLKNRSIDVIRDFSPDAVLGPAVNDTIKGTVAHMKPPVDSVRRADEPARARWIVFPRYEADAAATLNRFPKASAFMQLATNSFNYDLHGERGFELLAQVIDECDCYEFTYSQLEDACAVFEELSRTA